MSVRTVLGASVVAAILAAGCGGESDSIATSDSAPGTLAQLDDVVITVAPGDLVGEPIRLEDVNDDGDVEIVEAEIIGTDAGSVAADGEGTSVQEIADSDADTDTDGNESDGDESDDGESDDDGLNPLGGDDPEDKRMPDVVCMGLQEAQDEIQDRGVFFSKSVDATGDGRRQLFDRNWIVVDQDPGPGEPIGENEATLSVVKKDEDNDC